MIDNLNPNRRRHRRVPIQIPVTLVSARSTDTMLTDDISLSGVFVRTDSPERLRRLIKLCVTLPDTGEALEMLAMVVYAISPEQAERLGRVPGMGLNLYGLMPEMRQRWADYVKRTQELFDAPGFGADAVSAVVEPLRRAHPRFVATLKVRVAAVDVLYDMLTHNVSLGGAFLNTEHLLPQGEMVRVVFVHPDDASEFTLNARVVRTVERPPESRGIGVKFEHMASETEEAFETFIVSGLTELDEEPLLGGVEDSKLL